MNSTGLPSLDTYRDQSSGYRAAHLALDPSFKTIFDDLSEGVLVVDVAGHRVYSNAALNDLVRGNACLPTGSAEPPSYVPVDQRQRYLQALKGTSSLLTFEGSGAASTWLELAAPGGVRLRTKVTISAFTAPRGWRFAVWLFHPELPQNWGPGRAFGRDGGAGNSFVQSGFSGWCPPAAVESLTRRERDVLQLLLDGMRVSSIARNLYLSPQTVRNHLKAIFRKLGAHSQAELLDSLRASAPPLAALPVGDLDAPPLPNMDLGGKEGCS